MSIFYSGGMGYNFVTAAEASEAKHAARRAGREADDLGARLERALLACEAMWSMMRDKLGVTDEELIHRINEIDLSDGKLDGKVRRPAVTCPKCNRVIPRRNPKCMYCGQAIMQDPFV
jgi:hypothetical protein